MNEGAMPERNLIASRKGERKEGEKKMAAAVENQPFIYLPPNAGLSRPF